MYPTSSKQVGFLEEDCIMYSTTSKDVLLKKDDIAALQDAQSHPEEMKENWKVFLAKTTAKSKSHTTASRYWNKINKTLLVLLVLLGVITTFLALLPGIPNPVVAAIAASFTLIACVLAFLCPAARRQIHLRASREFQLHMLRMVRCKSYFEYDELWQDYNKSVFEEPFLNPRHCFPVNRKDIQWTMTPELLRAILYKKEEIKKQAKQYVNRSVGTTTDMFAIEPNPYHNTSLHRPINYYNPYQQNQYQQNQPRVYTVDSRYGNQNAMVTGMNRAVVSTNPNDEAFELVVSEQSQGFTIWGGEGKQKKKQTFQQLKRSQTTTN